MRGAAATPFCVTRGNVCICMWQPRGKIKADHKQKLPVAKQPKSLLSSCLRCATGTTFPAIALPRLARKRVSLRISCQGRDQKCKEESESCSPFSATPQKTIPQNGICSDCAIRAKTRRGGPGEPAHPAVLLQTAISSSYSKDQKKRKIQQSGVWITWCIFAFVTQRRSRQEGQQGALFEPT